MSELDRLLEAARQAEPEPLGEAAMDALIANARRSSARATAVDRVLGEARRAEPDPLTERELRSMAQRAAMTGRARHRRWTRRRVMATSALAATLAAAAVTLIVLEPRIDPPVAVTEGAPREVPSEPTDLDLPTGDRLVAASGARFEVELPDARVRSVRLGGGAMLFDVRPIDEGRFSVSTPNARIVVLGTVFSVQASERATTVWVYEGAVRIEGADGETAVVEAGGVLHLGAGEAGADALATAGREAALRRVPADPIAAATLAAATPPDPPASDRAEPSREPRVARDPAPRVEAPSERALAPPAEPRTPADVRALIASGEAGRALAIAEEAVARGETDPWRMLEGDALRVLGRFEDAASAYQRAARDLPAPRRQQAGFLEARVRMTELSDEPGALRALRDAEVTRNGSVLRERGMALEVQLLTRLGRDAEAAAIAADYLRAYPEGPDAESMRARASSDAEDTGGDAPPDP